MREGNTYESITLEEYGPQFWSCGNCFCGLCVEGCPAYRESKNEAVSARGLAQIGLSILSGEIGLTEVSEEILYACTGCRWCETFCSMNTPRYIQIHGTRRTKVSGATMSEIFRSKRIEESGKIPKEVRNALNNIALFGNPYGGGKDIKDEWCDKLGIPMGNSDTILYVGSTVPYEARSTQMAEAIVSVLKAVQLSFGMFGSNEKESGAFSRMMGEEGLFLEMAEHNIGLFKKHSIKQIICLSPHDYDVFKHHYEGIEDVEVIHYTQILCELIEYEKIRFKNKVNKKVTFHDPCYLGRQNHIYDEPRKILQSIPGVELIEMKNSRETALCCGGGGSGLFLELPDVRMDKTRADQIKEVNPDCLVVACPNCYQMLEDAINSRDYGIEVRDIAQLVIEAL